MLKTGVRYTSEAIVPAVLVAVAMILGGGGSSNPATELILHMVAGAVVLCWSLHSAMVGRPLGGPSGSRAAWLVALLLVAVPLIQLIPLPPVLWQALPGRNLQLAALSLVHAADTWQPISVAPLRTMASLAAIALAAAVLLFASSLDLSGYRAVLVTICVVAAASILLGGVQLASGAGRAVSFYEQVHRGNLIGFQANRNAQADVLQIALLAAAALAAPLLPMRSPRDRIMVMILALFAVTTIIATVMTASRAGILILPVSVGMAILIARPRLRLNLALLLTGGVALGGALLAVLWRVPALQRVAGRFANDGVGREDLWRDSLVALQQVWPIGAGTGNFLSYFLVAERLETVDPSFPARAHNDWLEFGMEGGILAVLVLIAAAGLLGWRVMGALRSPATEPAQREWRAQVLFGTGALIVIALHSLVDYPLRSMSLACLAAFAAAAICSNRGRIFQ